MTGLLLDHLWQSTLFAATAALLALALRHNGAKVRFWVWFAAAAKFLIPFAGIAWAAGWLAAHLHAQAPAPPRLELARQVLEPMTARVAARTIRSLDRTPFDIGPWLGAAWILGSAAILRRRAVQWRSLRRTLAAASPLAVPSPLPAVEARTKDGPAVVGLLRLVLVLPRGLAEQLTPAELEAVLEHELHHVRRLDNLLALPLLLVQALFWFHPLVWWIGCRMLAERERACDEAVLDSGIDAETYARGLLEACRLQLEPSLVLAAAMGGANLKRRIRWIMADDPPRPLGAPGGVMLTAAIGAALVVPVLAGVYTAAPAAAARMLVAVGRPIAAALPSPPARATERPTHARPPARPEPVRVALVSTPAVEAEFAAYAPPTERPIRLTRRSVVPAFPPASPDPPAAATAPAAIGAPSSADPAFLRALAERAAYVTGAELAGARLDLRSANACPTPGVMDAERRLGGEAVSTAFDGRVRRFVDEVLAGKLGPRDLSPAMAQAVDQALPALQPALAARFADPGAARLIGEDPRGRDAYLVRTGAVGYALVLVDDLGQIDAALFCTAS